MDNTLSPESLILDSNHINFNIIDKNTNFWLIRSKKGAFFDEFTNNKFIAVGWNEISTLDLKRIENAKNTTEKQKIELSLLQRFEKSYPNNKQARQSINKCYRFLYEIQSGDIVVIIGEKNGDIIFAKANDYYEESTFSTANEIEVNTQIDEGYHKDFNIKCPYNKRRNIEILKKSNIKKLNPKLFKMLNSYHSLSKIDKNEYSTFILRSVYNCFVWEGKVNVNFNIENNNDIDAYDFSSFIYNIAELFKNVEEDVNINVKTSVNSPGDLLISLESIGASVFDFISSPSTIMIIILAGVAVMGGKLGPIELKSFTQFQKDIIKSKYIDEKEQQEVRKMTLENDSIELDNELKKLEILERKLNSEKSRKILDNISKASENLHINKDDISNIINLSNFKKDE